MLILDEGKYSKVYKINIKFIIFYLFYFVFDYFLEFFLKKWLIILNKRKFLSIFVVFL